MREEAGNLLLWQPKTIFAIAKNVDWTPGPGLVLWFDGASSGQTVPPEASLHRPFTAPRPGTRSSAARATTAAATT